MGDRARKAALRPGPRCSPLAGDRFATGSLPPRSEKWVHPTEAWGAPQPLRAGPLVSRLLAVGSRESCQTVCQQVEGGTSSVLFGRKKNEQKKQSPREPESSSRFRNGHSAPTKEDLRKKIDFSVPAF